MGGAEHGHGGEGGDFRAKVWSMSGGPYCRPKHWRRNTAIAMFGVFLVCIPIAKLSAELEVIISKAVAAARTRRSRRCFSTAIPGPCIVHKLGADILHDPWFNKDTGFPLSERDRLGLRGLLPPRVMSCEQQYDRFSPYR